MRVARQREVVATRSEDFPARWARHEALAWLLAQQPWIVPIPGTRRLGRIEENAAATTVGLFADEIADLDALAARIGVAGERYNAEHLGYLDR